MKTLVRAVQLVVLVAITASLHPGAAAASVTTMEMSQIVGGSVCSAVEGAALIFGIAGFANPGFGVVALALGAGAMIWC